MIRRVSSICPFCEARAWLGPAPSTSWQPSRTAATLQKRKPSRMVLSPKVAHASPSSDRAARPVKRSRNSPFGGMNVTTPPRELQNAKNTISAAERKRQTRMGSKGQKEEKLRDPMKALKMQRALANVSYNTRSRVKHSLLERDEFNSFQLLPSVKDSISAQALRGMVDVSPTPIQALAVPALLGTEDGKRGKRRRSDDVTEQSSMRQFLLAAETGSGKTLAYALPVIDAIKRSEALQADHDARQTASVEASWTSRGDAKANSLELESPPLNELDSSAGRPRAIVLVPTAELVTQVGALFKSLSHTVKFRAAMISASFTGTVIRNRLFSAGGVDVVIATPHLLNSIAETDPNILSRVSHLVIDEADSLLDRSFSPITSSIIDRAAPSLEQLIFCSATIPRSLDSYLRKRYPDVKRLATPNLHAIPRRVQLSVVDIDKLPYQGNRDLACAQTIWDIGKDAAQHGDAREEKLVVFVNEREKAMELATFLRSKGINAHALSRDSDDRKQAEILADFTGTSSAASKARTSRTQQSPVDPDFAISPGELAEQATMSHSSTNAKRHLQNVKVLVMTDLGSRGIDTLAVRHVLLYDVPHTSIDFIHRLGRVGRMGRRGRGIVLVGRHDRKDIVREVRDGMFKGQALI